MKISRSAAYRTVFSMTLLVAVFFAVGGCARNEKMNANTGTQGVQDTPVQVKIPQLEEKDERPSVLIGNERVVVEVADTLESRAQGLSDHAPLAENEGMLFVFDEPGVYTFWMKDMLFPLDMVWIRDGHVVDVSEHVPVVENGKISIRRPQVPSIMVLEVNAGWIKTHRIRVGDPVDTTKAL